MPTTVLALKNAKHAETEQWLSVLNYLVKKWQKFNVAMKASLESLQIIKNC